MIEIIYFHTDGRVKLEHFSKCRRFRTFGNWAVAFRRQNNFVNALWTEYKEERWIGSWRCEIWYFNASGDEKRYLKELTVYTKTSVVNSFKSWSARAFVFSLNVHALLVTEFVVFKHILTAIRLQDALRRVHDILTRRTVAAWSMGSNFAFIVALKIFAEWLIWANELIIGTVNVSIAELWYV